MDGACPRLVVGLLAWSAIAAPPRQATSFGEHELWDDGKVELSRYTAEEVVDGETRRFTAWSLVVAERLDPAQLVATEAFALDQVAVLGCRWLLRPANDAGGSQELAALSVRRSDGLVMKAAFSSQEWRGTTFALWRRDVEGFETRSWRVGEGDARHPLEELGSNALFFEQLPIWIRGRHPERARREAITLIAKRLATAKCSAPERVDATLWFDGAQGEGAARRLRARVVAGAREETLLFATKFPHVLDEWRRADGSTWKLEQSERVDAHELARAGFAGPAK
jgi:hypothetical protein